MSSIIIGIAGIIILVLILLLRMPIAYSMLWVGFAGFCSLVSVEAGFRIVARDIFQTINSYSLSIIPLFILMGEVSFRSGISRRLYYSAHKWMGHLPGGLAIATICGCAGFAAICGSSAATAATMGTVTIPEMRRFRYARTLCAGSVAAGGTLGILIPPSVVLIIYGIQTEQSIGKLLFAGILPGILLTSLFIATIYIMARLRPQLAPRGPQTSFREKLASLSGIRETLILFSLVMGGLYAGWFTPTEAGGIGAIGAIGISLVRRTLAWQGFCTALTATLQTSCMCLLILAAATIFGRFLTVSNIPHMLVEQTGGLALPNVIVLVIILFIYLLGGCFMDALAFMILTLPIFYPLAIGMGFDPIWFGIIITLVTEMGAITPPVGINVYIISGIAKEIPMETIFRGILPFLIPFVICIAILIAFPKIALFLPSMIQ